MTATLDRLPVDSSAPQPSADRPRWQGPSLAGLLVLSALLNLWDLSASGWANSFYAAAVQAGGRSWTALLFGSFDAGNFITVDKPPAAMWVMGLSARIFGFSSWSMLVPQALLGVASVALLYATVRRVAGPGAALLAGLTLALTPVVVLMFRFNNPDALLVLLLIAAAYCVSRSLERAGTGWLLLAGVAIGFGFLTKMGQALVVVPAFTLTYLAAAPTGLGRRLWQLAGAGAAIVVSAGWYVALVALWPASSRPYIGGSQTNSLWELAVGYNGLSRLLGRSGASGGGAGHQAAGHGHGVAGHFAGMHGGAGGFGGFAGRAGLTRLFAGSVGTQDGWLLPAAIALLVGGLWLLRGAPRTDRTRAALLLWGGWLLVTVAVFSFMAGTFHSYYTVALAPSVAALTGIGGCLLWRRRTSPAGRIGLAVLVVGTGVWTWILLDRTPTWLPALRWVVVAAAVLAALRLLLPGTRRSPAGAAAALAVLAGLLGPAGYSVQTALTPHTGGMPTAGPTAGSTAAATHVDRRHHRTGHGAMASGTAPGGAFGSGFAGMRGGQQRPDPAVVALLRAAGTTWSAATVSASSAAPLELSSDTSVMAIGGFRGSNPAPTLDQFKADVTARKVHYFMASNGPHRTGAAGRTGHRGGRFGRLFGNRGISGQITTWVQQHFRRISVGGQTFYDLTQPRQ
jgi:4-amino-4-deoxy-L-arabinose transferase-like glycosyltransferase